MKRIFLFLLTNLAVMIVLGITLSILFTVFGLNRGSIGGLMLLAAVFGMGGAFISLAMSKWVAKMATGAQVITQPSSTDERWLVDTVRRQAQAAGIGMPEVAIYNSPDVNAFATGMSRNNALVAVSTGLLHEMQRDEVEAVLGHEISHIANGDMVTMTLLQGVLNTFVIFFARIVAWFVSQFFRGENDEGNFLSGVVYFVTALVFDILFGILASVVVAWFSRQREYRADAGGARLAGAPKMIAALQRLKQMAGEPNLPAQVAAFGINGKSSLALLFSSHPPLDERIAALQESAK